MLKNNGIVADVFTQENIVTLIGNIGIGHNRYPTAGSSRACEAQPMYTNFPFGIGMAHNGNLTNTSSLAAELQQHGRHVNTDSDSEVLLNVFAEELNNERNEHVTPDCVFAAAQKVMTRCKGAFAVVALIHDVGLLAFRDPHGIRPLCFGARKSAHGMYTLVH
jgi:amidophosphoribosyltransferase